MFITFFDLYGAHQGTTIYRMFTLKKVHKLRSKMNFHREIIGMHMKEIENSANKNEKQTNQRQTHCGKNMYRRSESEYCLHREKP